MKLLLKTCLLAVLFLLAHTAEAEKIVDLQKQLNDAKVFFC
jgi:hypothetical protein